MASCQVRVAVRIRPLTPQEVGQGDNQVVEAIAPTVGIGERKFTYDAVFDSHVTQPDLYASVSGPLLNSFLDGYNATIMAYGQTGSGKTFTMGSEAHADGEDMCLHPGLIPRFMSDVFANLEQRKSESDAAQNESALLEYRVSASFLEVYGEDVHDLLDKDRKTLPLRENANGGVVVQGLTSRSVSNTDEALNVLHEGTLNRTTAATLMNLHSSRSHAVFTVHLQQTNRTSNGGDLDVTTTSCFTFVDLAGSERMKKTGAEGERAKEGIKINEGLLALGNVINALADEQRLAKEKKIHVPYRQSKLTRLLQDALGGNSQTLFLACVSPADSNASETLSTLHYANRARNIKNAPTKNVDASVAELQRLHALTHVLQSELVKSRFGHAKSSDEIGHVDENLMNQQNVKDYLESLHRAAEAHQGAVVPLKSQTSSSGFGVAFNSTTVAPFGPLKTPMKNNSTGDAMTPGRAPLGEKSVNRTQYLLDEGDDLLLDEVNPDEEMAILDQLLELQHHDNEYEKKHKSNEEHLKEVEGELEEQEGMLLQLKESLKVYHTLKARYEVLMGEVQQLEAEKKNLVEQLEKAVVDPSKGCSLAIKKRLEKVEISLARARSETRKHQQKYRKAEQQAQKSKTLESKIVELKNAKVAMIKKQKESAARHREYTESKTREIMALKRKERTAGQKVSKLEAEIKIHKNNLEKRKDYSIKLSSKLKQTESHLMKLLAMRKKELHHRSSVPTPARKRNVLAPAPRGIPRKHASPTETFAAESNETKSIVFLLDKAVAELVSKSQTKRRYEERIAEYSDTMRELIAEVNLLKEAKKKRQETNSDEVIEEIHSREQNVEDLELKLELVGCDLETLKSNLPSGEEASTLSLDSDVAVTKVLASVDAPKLRTVFKEVISKFADSEVERQRLAEGLQRKESTLESFNMEVDSLNNKINTLTNEINQRRAMSESGDGHFEKIEKLTAEKARLSEELHGAQARVTKLTMEVANLKDKAAERFREKSDFKEKLIVAEAIAKQHSEAHPSEPILTKLQGIWKDLGVSEIYREDAQRKIDTCLEDTCNRILEEASKLKANTIAEINRLENELTSISSVLGKDPPPVIDVKANGVTLLPLCESLREEASKIRPEYLSAVERRMNLVNDARTLVDAIGREKAQPSSKLTELIEGQEKQGSSIKSGREQRAEVLRNVQGMVDSLDRLMGSDSTDDHEMESITEPSSPLTDDYNYGPPRSLYVDVLDSCEKEVSRLRLLKSEILVQNSEVREEIAALVKDMHLSADEIVALTEQVADFQNENTSAWWATDVALQVARSLLDNESCVLTTPAFSKHLDSIRLAMETVAAHRRSLSQALKGAVDRAQKTLLMTVDGETDVSEAYASFHDALFQLPSLSKEHVDACIAELNALVAGVDAMRQSEVEALTVVWEALDVRPNQRSSFWSKLEEDTTQMQLTDENLFDSVQSVESRYKESWVVKATNEAHKVYADLSMRLFKLESIHRSVETLRTRQDAKSRIISLDSEIRILSAKLGDFEDKRCSKSRLLTKKTGSGALLKEERFRKQMQTKFTSKLEQLARLLHIWIETEGESFDANLLSDEVRNLLDNADRMETYVESRTVRMHLNLKTHSTSATSNGKRSRPETRTTRSRSEESRSWSPNRPNRSRTGSRDGPSPPASRPRKVARTGRCAIASPSPQHDGSKSISRSATVHHKKSGLPPLRGRVTRSRSEETRPANTQTSMKDRTIHLREVKDRTSEYSDSVTLHIQFDFTQRGSDLMIFLSKVCKQLENIEIFGLDPTCPVDCSDVTTLIAELLFTHVTYDLKNGSDKDKLKKFGWSSDGGPVILPNATDSPLRISHRADGTATDGLAARAPVGTCIGGSAAIATVGTVPNGTNPSFPPHLADATSTSNTPAAAANSVDNLDATKNGDDGDKEKDQGQDTTDKAEAKPTGCVCEVDGLKQKLSSLVKELYDTCPDKGRATPKDVIVPYENSTNTKLCFCMKKHICKEHYKLFEMDKDDLLEMELCTLDSDEKKRKPTKDDLSLELVLNEEDYCFDFVGADAAGTNSREANASCTDTGANIQTSTQESAQCDTTTALQGIAATVANDGKQTGNEKKEIGTTKQSAAVGSSMQGDLTLGDGVETPTANNNTSAATTSPASSSNRPDDESSAATSPGSSSNHPDDDFVPDIDDATDLGENPGEEATSSPTNGPPLFPTKAPNETYSTEMGRATSGAAGTSGSEPSASAAPPPKRKRKRQTDTESEDPYRRCPPPPIANPFVDPVPCYDETDRPVHEFDSVEASGAVAFAPGDIIAYGDHETRLSTHTIESFSRGVMKTANGEEITKEDLKDANYIFYIRGCENAQPIMIPRADVSLIYVLPFPEASKYVQEFTRQKVAIQKLGRLKELTGGSINEVDFANDQFFSKQASRDVFHRPGLPKGPQPWIAMDPNIKYPIIADTVDPSSPNAVVCPICNASFENTTSRRSNNADFYREDRLLTKEKFKRPIVQLYYKHTQEANHEPFWQTLGPLVLEDAKFGTQVTVNKRFYVQRTLIDACKEIGPVTAAMCSTQGAVKGHLEDILIDARARARGGAFLKDFFLVGCDSNSKEAKDAKKTFKSASLEAFDAMSTRLRDFDLDGWKMKHGLTPFRFSNFLNILLYRCVYFDLENQFPPFKHVFDKLAEEDGLCLAKKPKAEKKKKTAVAPADGMAEDQKPQADKKTSVAPAIVTKEDEIGAVLKV